jgi:hypothetical protein
MLIVLALFDIATNYVELFPDIQGQLPAILNRLMDTSKLVHQKSFPELRR